MRMSMGMSMNMSLSTSISQNKSMHVSMSKSMSLVNNIATAPSTIPPHQTYAADTAARLCCGPVPAPISTPPCMQKSSPGRNCAGAGGNVGGRQAS